ncbi:Proton-dependent oligopeptide transporter family [Sesbania bispinosa]|nr:Proton-dependent oligopeptide transporter family [Sesbania bispinosa]
MGMFYLSIYLIALGNGGYQPNIATFGADQFDDEHSKEGPSKVAFFSYFYLALNLGQLFSLKHHSGSAFAAVVLFLVGTPRKSRVQMTPNGEDLYVMDTKESSNNANRKILHTHGFKFLDRAAFICPVSQVHTETSSNLALHHNILGGFHTNGFSFCGASVAVFIFFYRRVLDPFVGKLKKSDSKGLTELQRMGIGLVIAVMAMVSAGIVECYRLKYAKEGCTHCNDSSQLEFCNAQTPDGLKSFGSALCMTSISLVSIVMKISTEDHMPGWIPGNLNKGHLDRFYFLLAALTSIDLIAYIACAKWYKSIQLDGKREGNNEPGSFAV